MRESWRNTTAPVRALIGAKLIASFGSTFIEAALWVWIVTSTGSTLWLSAFLAVSFLLRIASSPLAARLGAHRNRFTVMIGCRVMAMVALLLFAILISPSIALVFAAALAISSTIFAAAASAALGDLTDEPQRLWANGLYVFGDSAGMTLGPLMGGIAASLLGGLRSVLLIGAVLAIASILLLLRAKVPAASREKPKEKQGRLRDGIAAIRSDPTLLAITISTAFALLATTAAFPANVAWVLDRGGGAFDLGLAMACWGVGAASGGLIASRVAKRAESVVSRARLIQALGYVVLSTVGFFWIGLVAFFITGVCISVITSWTMTVVQKAGPEIRGQVAAASSLTETLPRAVGIFAGAPIVVFFGAQVTYAVIAAFLLGSSLLVVLVGRNLGLKGSS